jgi:serine/threonine-protein kinase
MQASGAATSRAGRLPQLAKYDVIEEIGHGGMATVYRACDRRLAREVAIKVIHPHLRDSKEVVSRFWAEAKAVAKLRHENIVEVFDVSEEGEEEQYLVCELLRGTTLRKLLQQRLAMPPEVAAGVALELLAALGHAHGAGVIHRDVKPENVLIEHHRLAPTNGDEAEARVTVKLTDFGIAKLLDAQGVTSTGQVLGSPAHMAPEQIEGLHDVDERADVFGLGVLLYECTVGHLPFEGNNPAQVLRRVLEGRYPEAVTERDTIGKRWSALLDRALAHDPAHRFSDTSAMRDAIRTELDRLGVTDPRAELEAWLDDPEAHAKEHQERIVARLTELGSAARKRGDVIAAAGDYNRALAYAPNDVALLKIVAGMHRAQARVRLLRRGAGVLAIALVLGVVAFAISRAVRGRGEPTGPLPSTSALAIALPSTNPPASSAFASTKPVPTASATSFPHIAVNRPDAAASVASKANERVITLDLWPPELSLSVDGAAAQTRRTNDSIRLDAKSHVLRFSCDWCLPVDRSIIEGDKDETIRAELQIKPATLRVEGDPSQTYLVLEHPDVLVRVGPNSVKLPNRKFETVQVKQIDTREIVRVELAAGESRTAHFSNAN